MLARTEARTQEAGLVVDLLWATSAGIGSPSRTAHGRSVHLFSSAIVLSNPPVGFGLLIRLGLLVLEVIRRAMAYQLNLRRKFEQTITPRDIVRVECRLTTLDMETAAQCCMYVMCQTKAIVFVPEWIVLVHRRLLCHRLSQT